MSKIQAIWLQLMRGGITMKAPVLSIVMNCHWPFPMDGPCNHHNLHDQTGQSCFCNTTYQITAVNIAVYIYNKGKGINSTIIGYWNMSPTDFSCKENSTTCQPLSHHLGTEVNLLRNYSFTQK